MRICCLPAILFTAANNPFSSPPIRHFAILLPATTSGRLYSSHRSSSDSADFEQQIYSYKLSRLSDREKQLRYHQADSFKHSVLKKQITVLKEEIGGMESRKRKSVAEQSPKNTTGQVLAPHLVTLEVLSNGTTHMPPAAFLRTPTQAYLFNCPEGTSRFVPSLRVRPNNVHDFFFTRANWRNIGGISGILMDKFNVNERTRLHGPRCIKQYLEMQRPFLDTDFGNNSSFPVAIDELCCDGKNQFEDAALRVRYIPLTDADAGQFLQAMNVAFLVELKQMAPSIDPLKLMALGVPKGPHIAQLKAGTAITLADGRLVRPEDVFKDKKPEGQGGQQQELPNLLVAEVETAQKLDALCNSAVLQDFVGVDARPRQLNYILHFSPPPMFDSAPYREWMRSFGPSCRHLVLNGTGSLGPMNEGIYKAQQMYRAILPDAFPELYPPPEHYDGQIYLQDSDYDASRAEQSSSAAAGIGPVFLGAVYRRFSLRGSLSAPSSVFTDHPNALKMDFSLGELDERLEQEPKIGQRLEEFRNFLNNNSLATRQRGGADPFPLITFLGTASATTAKYRNVTAHLVQLNAQTALMVDCGEGTHGQLKVLFGPDKCAKLLTSLHAIFITHSHLDHCNGLHTVVQERFNAFHKLGIPYRPVILVSNLNVRKSMSNYTKSFNDDIDRHIRYVDLTQFYARMEKNPRNFGGDQPPMFAQYNRDDRRVATELTSYLPSDLYSPEAWNLRSVKTVQVLHTKMADAFVFECRDNGRRVVFSGDTKPSALLEAQGRDADVLVHECTFGDGMEFDAECKRHSTMRQAFDSAQRMRAKHVIFTHFSSRYSRVPQLPDYLLEAGNCSIAFDNMQFPFDLLPVFPRLLPLFREMFAEELFHCQAKQMNKRLGQKEEDGEERGRQHGQRLKQEVFNNGSSEVGKQQQNARNTLR